jgi:hypothetical protein
VRLLRMAETQHGVVVDRQARACGISTAMMNQVVAEGWFRPLRDHAFAVTGRPPSRWEDTVAVGLLAGPGAALSHGTAGAIHGLPGLVAPTRPEVTVATPRHPRLAGVVLHRVRHLDPCDLVTQRGVQVTSPARTIVDLASRLEAPLLARVLDEGSIARLWSPADVQACAERRGYQGRRGSEKLRGLLAERLAEPTADSVLELRMIRVLAPFAPFATQYHLVLDGELIILDIAWPQWRVGAEVDGWWTRSRSRTKFDRDLHRANLLIAHHWQVAHLTSTMDDATIRRDVSRLLPPEMTTTR